MGSREAKDEICPEMGKCLGTVGLSWLTSHFNVCIVLCRRVFILQYERYMEISDRESLFQGPGRRFGLNVEPWIQEEQCGFCSSVE